GVRADQVPYPVQGAADVAVDAALVGGGEPAFGEPVGQHPVGDRLRVDQYAVVVEDHQFGVGGVPRRRRDRRGLHPAGIRVAVQTGVVEAEVRGDLRDDPGGQVGDGLGIARV